MNELFDTLVCTCKIYILFYFKVLDMDKLMQPKIDEERKKIVDAAREEALENAIALVKQKIREQMELEQQAKEEAGIQLHFLTV